MVVVEGVVVTPLLKKGINHVGPVEITGFEDKWPEIHIWVVIDKRLELGQVSPLEAPHEGTTNFVCRGRGRWFFSETPLLAFHPEIRDQKTNNE